MGVGGREAHGDGGGGPRGGGEGEVLGFEEGLVLEGETAVGDLGFGEPLLEEGVEGGGRELAVGLDLGCGALGDLGEGGWGGEVGGDEAADLGLKGGEVEGGGGVWQNFG